MVLHRISVVITTLFNGCFYMQGQTTDIMSFNIRYDNPKDNENWWENRKGELANLIDYYHPDFVGIQEGLNDQVEFIKENTRGYDYIGVGRDDGLDKGEYTAIYYDSTKFHLIRTETFWLSESPETISVGWDASMERICTYGIFENKGTGDTLHIFNTHFDHRGERARLMSAKLIVSKINHYQLNLHKVVLMGDLNCEPGSEPIEHLKTGLEDGKEISEREFYGPLGTFNGFDQNLIPKRRIDYVFTINQEVLSYRHINDRRSNNFCVSDHLPVLIKIKDNSANQN